MRWYNGGRIVSYIDITKDNIAGEHICCAFSDKKSVEGYRKKKLWLKEEIDNGYVFCKLDERAKVFIEYGPAENAWVPVTASNYLMLGCFWVSGKYKKNGHGKALLGEVISAAQRSNKDGIAAVAGVKKFHFMSDAKWLTKQGFECVEKNPAGFGLFRMKFNSSAADPVFNDSVKIGECPEKKGVTVYYSNRCPYTEYHVKESLAITTRERGLSSKTIELQTREQAQAAPTPATIFSLFYNGRFITTDISVCMGDRFDRIIAAHTG